MLLRLMIILGLIALVLFAALIYYLRFLVPLRPKETGFEYVSVESQGVVRELDHEEYEDLKQGLMLHPADGNSPYTKSRYLELTTDKQMKGYIRRRSVPRKIRIISYKEWMNIIDEKLKYGI